MLGWLLSRRFIAHLEAEISWLRSEVRYEKARADRAHDALSTLRAGVAITTAYPAAPAEQTPPPPEADLAKLLQSSEFSQAGVG